MTIPFGRRRLKLTLAVTSAPTQDWDGLIPPGSSDQELARLSRQEPMDIDRARWEGLTLLYGGFRQN